MRPSSRRPAASHSAAEAVEQSTAAPPPVGGDTLTYQLETMKARQQALYGDAPPAASVSVTVMAGTNLPSAEAYWIASVGGSTCETSLPGHFETGVKDAPKGAPSWSSEPLTLPVHDVTSDLVLLLCDKASGAAHRRCVGRVVLPLADLLPLNPFGAQPAPLQVWACVFPPAPPAAFAAQATLSAATVAGIGLPPPAAERPLGLALVRVALTLERSVASAYLLSPSFDAPSLPTTDGSSAAPIVTPERILLVAHRLTSAISGVPALVRLTATRPWSAAFAIVFLTYWICFAMSAGSLPWWLLLAWTLNGVAIRMLTRTPSPWEPAGRAAQDARLAADLRLARLDQVLVPLLSAAESLASILERAASATAMYDARASVLAAAPLLVLVFVVSVGASVVWLLASLVGGVPFLLFWLVASALSLNIMTFHKTELYAWLGARGEAAEGESARSAPDAPPSPPVVSFAPSATRRSAAGDAFTGCWARAVIIGSNLLSRMPDAPTQAHRAIARAGLQADYRPPKGGKEAEMV